MTRVSVCVPNLNQRPFIEERLETIHDQLLKDWECIVYDNYSDDGSWEIIQNFSARDSRFHVFQAPREGMYANWNNCVQQAKGEFIYIATSDDTMSPGCLEKMVAALQEHPDCDICQCGLQMIDREGRPMNGENGELCWEKLANASFYGKMLQKPHVRKAPFDGLAALAYGTAWTSMTQVLIRRSLFEKVGLFPTEWGAIGDAAWQMKAGLVTSVVFIPEKLATWRYYEGQGSGVIHQHAMSEGWMEKMNAVTLQWLGNREPKLAKRISRSGLLNHFQLDANYHRLKEAFMKNGLIGALLELTYHPIGSARLISHVLRQKTAFLKVPSKQETVHNQIEKILKQQ